MILFTDSIIQIRYAPATDVMTVSLQVVRAYEAAEIRSAFQAILANIKEYHVTRILLDFTRSTLDLTETEYQQNITALAVGLKQTPLRKIARIGTQDPVREQKITRMYDSIKINLALQTEFQNFKAEAEALKWLITP